MSKIINTNKETTINKLKTPSHTETVTPRNQLKLIKLFPEIPDPFEKSDIVNNEKFPLRNKTAISRVLSQFKALRIINEEREIVRVEGKKINKQLFHLTKHGLALKQASEISEEYLFETWRRILRKTDMYKAITTTEEFKEHNCFTVNTLRRFIVNGFSKKVKNPQERMLKAERYFTRFFKETRLFTFDGEYFRPIIYKSMQGKNYRLPEERFYYAKTNDFELKVRYTKDAFEMLEMQVGIAKKKLAHIEKSKEEDKEE